MSSHDRRGSRILDREASRRCRSRSPRSRRLQASRRDGMRQSSRSRSIPRALIRERPPADGRGDLMLLVTEETAWRLGSERGLLRSRYDVRITFGDIFGETEQVLVALSDAGERSLHDAGYFVLKEIAAAQKNTTIIDVRIVVNRWIIDALNLCRVLNDAQYACAEVAERDGHFQAVSLKGTIQECSRLLDVACAELRRRCHKCNRQYVPEMRRSVNGHRATNAASSSSAHGNPRQKPLDVWNRDRGEGSYKGVERSQTRIGLKEKERSSSRIRGRNISSRSTTARGRSRSGDERWCQRRRESCSRDCQRDTSHWRVDNSCERRNSGRARLVPSRSASPCSQGSLHKDTVHLASPATTHSPRAGITSAVGSRDDFSQRERSLSVALPRNKATVSPKASASVAVDFGLATSDDAEDNASHELVELKRLAAEALASPEDEDGTADAPPAGGAAEDDFDADILSPTREAVTSDPYMVLDPEDE